MRLHKIIFAFFVVTFLGTFSVFAEIDRKPVDSSATAPTLELYGFLMDNYSKRVVSGAVTSGVKDTRMADYIYSVTGHYPLINCFDFMEHYQCSPVNPSGWSKADYSNPLIEEDWVAKGGVVSYQWHWFVPIDYENRNNFSGYEFYCNGAGSRDTNFSAANALQEGTWEHEILNRDLDAVAGYFLNMQQKGIPVIWRPLHEACGNTGKYNGGKAWFWWGNSGAEVYKSLWKYMFEHFKSKGVHNLIWVWTSCGGDADWYPGDDMVDVIGLDYYENNSSKFHNSLINEYRFLQSISSRKMLALSECGAMPSLENMSDSGDMWSWVAPWNGDFTTGSYHNPPEFFRTEYSSPLIIHRDNRIVGGNDNPQPEYYVMALYSGDSVEMTWETTEIHVPASKASNIKTGDRLRVRVSEIGSDQSKYPKVMLRCDDGWSCIHQFDIWYDRGKSMPIEYTVTVTSGMLDEIHKGFFLGGEDCKVSRLELLSESETSIIHEFADSENDNMEADLYSIQGVLIRKSVKKADAFVGLPSGIYIYKGKKYIMR